MTFSVYIIDLVKFAEYRIARQARLESIRSGIMHQLQCQASQPLLRVESLPEKTSVARLRLEKVYDPRLEYTSYASRGPAFAFSGHTSIPGVGGVVIPLRNLATSVTPKNIPTHNAL